MDENDPPDHVFRWVEGVQWLVRLRVEAALGAEARAVGLRRLRILQLVPAGGARQKDLAERAHVTKQAMAELIDALEADGLVERTVDPDDGRAWLVRRSARGDRISGDVDRALGAVEAELADRVGAERYRTFSEVMRELGRPRP